MTAFGGVKKAVEAMRLGAGDYLTKPFEPDELPVAFLRCRAQRTAERREQHRAEGAAAGPDFFFGTGLAPLRARLEQILTAERRIEHGERLGHGRGDGSVRRRAPPSTWRGPSRKP